MKIRGWMRKGKLNLFNRRSGIQRRQLEETRNPTGGGPGTFLVSGEIMKDRRIEDRRKTIWQKLFGK